MKRVMATNGDNTGNGYGKEGGGRSTVVTMGAVQRTHPLVLRLERGGDGSNGVQYVALLLKHTSRF
jgi:hypothetical protein